MNLIKINKAVIVTDKFNQYNEGFNFLLRLIFLTECLFSIMVIDQFIVDTYLTYAIVLLTCLKRRYVVLSVKILP